jgi:hypothetical protein
MNNSKAVVDFIELAMKRLKRAIDADRHNREGGVEDLEFLNGDQWDKAELARRTRFFRPALTVNLLHKYVDQITGEERHNRPRIQVKPLSSDADMRSARIREGIITTTEHYSFADTIYDQAFEQLVSGRYGAWRVLTRWCVDDPWVQEMYLERIPNAIGTVWLDPSARGIMGEDANWGFILETLSLEEFKEKYPKAKVPGKEPDSAPGNDYEHWYDDETVTVAEYFVRKNTEVTIVQMKDGSVMTEERAKEKILEWEQKNAADIAKAQAAIAMASQMPVPPPGVQMPEMTLPGAATEVPGGGTTPSPLAPIPTGKPAILRSRKTQVTEIRHYLITCEEILKCGEDGDGSPIDGRKVPGEYIPVVLVKGREINIKGKTYLRSLITDAIDPQRLVNYWETSLAETIALAPKAPWVGTAKQFQGYESDYAQAHLENYPYLKYNPDEKAPGPPARNHPGNPPIALFQQAAGAKENLKQVIGMFNLDVGDESPERTGLAVRLKQQPGDVGTYAFIDNLHRGIILTGMIMNSMIPEVYDTERDVRLRSLDGSETFVPINTTAKRAVEKISSNSEKYDGVDISSIQHLIRTTGEESKYNDVTAGKYSTFITVGPSYSTQRTESAEAMMRLTTAMPDKMSMAADLIVKNLDIKDGEELSDRLRKTMPLGLVKLRPGEQPPDPVPPSPQTVLSMEKQKTEKLRQEASMMRMKLEAIRILKEVKEGKTEVRREVLNLLATLNSPTHPADKELQSVREESEEGSGEQLLLPAAE